MVNDHFSHIISFSDSDASVREGFIYCTIACYGKFLNETEIIIIIFIEEKRRLIVRDKINEKGYSH